MTQKRLAWNLVSPKLHFARSADRKAVCGARFPDLPSSAVSLGYSTPKLFVFIPFHSGTNRTTSPTRFDSSINRALPLLCLSLFSSSTYSPTLTHSHPLFPFHTPHKLTRLYNMRFSTALLVAALPALAAAAPLNDGKKWDYKESHHKDAMDLNSKVFDFSSTYVAYASPDQIINNNQTAVPGEEGASGVCTSSSCSSSSR